MSTGGRVRMENPKLMDVHIDKVRVEHLARVIKVLKRSRRNDLETSRKDTVGLQSATGSDVRHCKNNKKPKKRLQRKSMKRKAREVVYESNEWMMRMRRKKESAKSSAVLIMFGLAGQNPHHLQIARTRAKLSKTKPQKNKGFLRAKLNGMACLFRNLPTKVLKQEES